jgi:hypothetical protein
MKRLVFAVSAGFLLVAAQGAAWANPPIREVLPPGADSESSVCGPTIVLHSEGNTIRRTFTDDQGRTVRIIETYPGFELTFTNVETGASLSARLSGPLHLRVNPDGSTVFKGTGGWGWGEVHPGTLEPGLFILHGHITLNFDASGALTSSSFHGHTVNVCDTIAS